MVVVLVLALDIVERLIARARAMGRRGAGVKSA
jgi:hypothetical protein